MYTLYIGNKNYSSWSLRPWLVLKAFNIAFEERMLSFNLPDWDQRVRAISPAGRVPILVDDGFAIWDTIAICEYLAEKHTDKALWPRDARERARARSLVAEMHAGFSTLRINMPMNIEASFPGKGMNDAVAADIARIGAMWSECLARSGGPFLFGAFCIADAFYAPVATRFVTYGAKLPDACAECVSTLYKHAAMREWIEAAKREHDFVADDEPYRTRPDWAPSA